MIAGSGARSGPVLKPNMGQTAVSAVSQTASGECVCTCGVCVCVCEYVQCAVSLPLVSLTHNPLSLFRKSSLFLFSFFHISVA